MSFYSHVDDDVTVVLVVVGNVEHQHGAANRLRRRLADTRTDRDRLHVVGIGGRPVGLIAVGKGIVQRLDERGLVSDLLAS